MIRIHLLRNYSRSFGRHNIFQPLAPCASVFSPNSLFWLSVSYNSLLWSNFGSVSDRCSRRGSSSQRRTDYLAKRTSCHLQMTGTTVCTPWTPSCYLCWEPIKPKWSSHSTDLQGSFAELLAVFPLTFQFSVAESVATSGTSSQGDEVLSTALQSNGNDCAPGETENCICVSEWSTVTSLREKHAWKYQGAVLNFFFYQGDAYKCGAKYGNITF